MAEGYGRADRGRALDHQPLRGDRRTVTRRQERSAIPQLGDFYRHPAAAAGARGRDRRAAVRAIRLRELFIFNHQSNVAFDRRITCVGLKDLPDNMRAFGIIAVLEAVRNRMYANFERGVTTWLYIDEVPERSSATPPPSATSAGSGRRGASSTCICTGITQNCTYLLEPQGRRAT